MSTGDFYIDLKIGLIGKDWVTFTAQTAGANLFSLLIVDILIFSQAFRGEKNFFLIFLDAHQLIHTPLNLTHTENTIYTTSSFRSAFTFSPIPGENNFYRTRPIYLHLWQGFTLSRTTPNLMIFPYFSEDYLQNYGYLILYFEYKTPIKTFAYEFISICQFGVDCTQSSQQDIDFERLTLFYGGLPTICNVYPHTTWDSQIVNYAFKSTLLKRPKYFIAGYYPWDWELKSGSAGSTLENYSNRSYTLKLYSGPNTILDWSLVYYMYSEWGKFCLLCDN